MFDGQPITGGSLSLTVTVKLHVAVLPAPSAIRISFVVTPTGKADPLANPPVCVVTAPAQLSVPTGARSEERRVGKEATTRATTYDGQTITGGSLSLTVTVKLHVAVVPAASGTRNQF